MSNIVRKLTSRKLWLAMAGVVTGVALVFGAETSEIQTVAGAVTALASVITYIIAEGKVDAAAVAEAISAAQDAAGSVEEAENDV